MSAVFAWLDALPVWWFVALLLAVCGAFIAAVWLYDRLVYQRAVRREREALRAARVAEGDRRWAQALRDALGDRAD